MNSNAMDSSADSFHALERCAADWIARRDGGLSPAEQVELDDWIAADPRHAVAFAAMEAGWKALREPARVGQAGSVWRHVEKAQRRRRKQAAVLTSWTFAASLAAIILLFALSPTAHRGDREDSIAVRPDRRLMPDGSVIELNAGAVIETAFTAETRVVQLVRGEALFEVAKDPSRPFVVRAGAVHVRAVGTAFTVKFEPDQVNVLVTEGTVAVQRAVAAVGGSSYAEDSVLLDAGARMTVQTPMQESASGSPLKVQTLPATSVAAALAWRENRLEFTDTPLSMAIDAVKQRSQLRLVLGDSSLRNRTITGTFWANDAEGFTHLLEAGLNLVVERRAEEIVLRSSPTP